MISRPIIRISIYLSLAAVCALMLLPVIWAFVSSLKPLDEIYASPPTFSIDKPQWSNYNEAITRLPVLRFIFNSLLIATVSALGAVLTSSMAGFALARLSFSNWMPHSYRVKVGNRLPRLLFMLVLFSMLIPAPLLLIPRFMLFDALGWVNTYKPLIVPAFLGGGAFNVFLFRQFFKTIPREFDYAATLDGASTWQTYWYVILPMAKPAVITAALLSFVFHWQSFLEPLVYLSDFMTFPISLGLRMYQSMAGTWANLLMATSIIALVPVAVLFFICEKYIMQGLGVIGSESDTRL